MFPETVHYFFFSEPLIEDIFVSNIFEASLKTEVIFSRNYYNAAYYEMSC